ncbi:ABC-type multidrug/protein/lipid transport system, ATPase component [Streptococcus thermophilus MTCC 5460]|nr:ABC-type multidrug/protein/lipid transport system, ATPase component [Streptococcus thermophilus MTCC 5461]ELW74172.1 ABC-type multidrug/protein/lipid transport system, ATPase component [Streptococcus thermophilus MTCC 5460]
MALEVMFEISIPFVMANLLDKGVQQSNMSNIWLYGGLMLVCAFLSLFCGMQVGTLCSLCFCWIC